MKISIFFKEWLDAILNPRPFPWANNGDWQYFIKNATYANVCKALIDNDSLYFCWEKCTDNLRILLERIAKGNWPKLSNDFVRKNADKIFRVQSCETAKSEVLENYEKANAKYLIDENNQMLGIVLSKNTIITGLFYGKASDGVVECCKYAGYVPSASDIVPIYSNISEINNLLYEIGYNPIIQIYLLDRTDQVSLVGMPFHYKRLLGDKKCAQMVFLV